LVSAQYAREIGSLAPLREATFIALHWRAAETAQAMHASAISPTHMSDNTHTLNDIGTALTGGNREKRKAPKVVLPLRDKLLLSAPEAAAMLGMGIRWFHEKRPELPLPVQLGPTSHVRWRRADLEAYVASLAHALAHEEPPELRAGKLKKAATEAGGAKPRTGPISAPDATPNPPTKNREQVQQAVKTALQGPGTPVARGWGRQ
jgi:predicted DNA-binding transcriptional regulator AlpA